MLSKYIVNLLDNHNRVIVPDLGAFMLKAESAALYFNEFLRFNDGLLIDYIAEQEQLEKMDAAKKVKAYVDHINKQLATDKSIELKGLGTLYVDNNEKIQLKTSTSLSQSSVQAPMDSDPSPKEIVLEVEKTPVSNVEHTLTPPPVEVKEVKRETAQSTSSVSPRVFPTLEIKKKQPSIKSSPSKEKIKFSPVNTKNIIIVGIIGVLVISAIIYFSFFRKHTTSNANQNITIGNTTAKDSCPTIKDSTHNKKNFTTNSEHKSSKTVTHTQESKNNLPTVPTEEKKQVVPIPSKSLSSANQKYHIIAGTFSIEANADRTIDKFERDGYSTEKIHNEAKNLFYVSIASFSDKALAMQEIQRLKSSNNIETWLYSK